MTGVAIWFVCRQRRQRVPDVILRPGRIRSGIARLIVNRSHVNERAGGIDDEHVRRRLRGIGAPDVA